MARSSSKPPFKKQKSDGSEWRLYRFPRNFVVGNPVYLRSKSAKEKGKRATVVGIDGVRLKILLDENATEKSVLPKRILPIFQSLAGQLVIVTGETIPYRHMASSQILSTDTVLEVGCSTGEASAILVRYAQKWLGFDTSSDMVEQCLAKLPRNPENDNVARALKRDALADPSEAKNAVTETLGDAGPSVVFVDIGGNRELDGVLRMIDWCKQSFHPRLVVVKSRELEAAIQTANGVVVGDNGLIENCETWYKLRLEQLCKPKLPLHPLQAPMRLSPLNKDVPICRYHNYDVNGCKRHKDGICSFDHDHCHLCLERGHTALQCVLVKSDDERKIEPSR